jgi:hypothetical protein
MDVNPENRDMFIWNIFGANPTLKEITIWESTAILATCERNRQGVPANVVIIADGKHRRNPQDPLYELE